MDLYRFVLGIVLGLYIGFSRLNQLRFIARDPILTGILKVSKLPVQSTFWRFLNALHRNVARQMLTIMRTMRERVWEAANVKLEVVTIDTDTTVYTLYGQQIGGRKATTRRTRARRAISVCPAKAGVFSGSQPHQNKSQSSVAWIAGRKETEPRKSIDKAILGMVSESLGRNESERTGDPETLYLRGRAPADRAKAAWNVAN